MQNDETRSLSLTIQKSIQNETKSLVMLRPETLKLQRKTIQVIGISKACLKRMQPVRK